MASASIDVKHWPMSWDDVDERISYLIQRIQESKVEIKHIVGVAKGGVIPASLIWQVFPNTTFDIVRVRSYTSEGKVPPTIDNSDVLLYLNSPEVLIVDDICDSGDTFRLLHRYVPRAKFAAMLLRDECMFDCDYIGGDVEKGLWVDFPWERKA